MAIKECKECGGKVSSSAKVCPHCGAKQNKTNWKAIGVIVAIFYGVSFLNYLINGTPEKEKKEVTTQTKKINYSGVNEGDLISTYGKNHWEKEYGEKLPNDFKINLWEKSLDHGKSKGKVTGHTIPGNMLVVLTVNSNDYYVSDRETATMGWISKIQMRDISEKKKIFRNKTNSEIRAIREADRKFDPALQWKEHMAEVDRLTAIYRKEVIQKYNISDDELQNIIYEGAINKWK